jgi:hypothetical protein
MNVLFIPTNKHGSAAVFRIEIDGSGRKFPEDPLFAKITTKLRHNVEF